MSRKITLLLKLNSIERKILRISILLLFSLPLQFGYSQTTDTQEIRTLESGKPIEREITGGQKNNFQINFAANQYAKLIVEQRGIDVVVRLLDANGKVVVEYDAEPRSKGEEVVELTAKTAGNYKLTIEPRQKSALTGRYEIRIVELRNATEKDFAIDETRKLIFAANSFWRAGKYDEALPFAEQALAIRVKELGAEHLDVSQALFVLANIYSDKGDYDKAGSFYQRALEIREKILGKDHLAVSAILNNFGLLYKDKGDYVKAESLLLRVLEIREKTLEPNHLLIASVLNNLAIIYRARGNIEKAAMYYQRVLEIREKALGPESPEVATTLNNIANLYTDVARAEPLYLRALAIREKTLGPEHPDVAQTLYNLAVLYSFAGKFDKAEPLAQRALSIMEKSLGAEHPITSLPLNLLAGIYKNTGNFAKAELLYQRSIAIKEKTQGQYHPYLGGALTNLANLYAVKGEIDKAVSTQARANSIFEYNIALNLAVGSEREKLNYLKTILDIENQTLSLNFLSAANSPAAASLGVTTVLQRKGRVLDAMSDSLGALRRRFNKQDQALLDNLNETTTQLVGFILQGRQEISADEYEKKIKALETKRESLENQISRQSAGFYEQTKPITLKAVQEIIPKNAALIEFSVYDPISPKEFEFGAVRLLEPEARKNARYAVYVIHSQGEAWGKDIGNVKEIDKLIDAFRQALRDPKRQDAQKLARAVDEKVMQPVRAVLGDSTQLLVSPGGDLNLIPFEALVDEQSRFLIENYSFTYLTSGRDLLRMQVKRESKSQPLVIANPAFGAANQTTGTTTRNRKRQNITAARNLSDTYFAPLAGTAQEARSIQALFPDSTFLTGAQATESALKQTIAPRILHIATHGFFLQDTEANDSKATTNGNNTNLKIENPLLRSGLALAGANQRGGTGGEDGILTALEASGLNLWGTKLVVLSACDTGLGEVKIGEGVYGFRRAFVLAGTESLVMSLWSVSDYVTRELMTNYYKNLKQGMGRGASLRQVQLEMLKKPNRQHPFYWASFIQSGEWANLEGKR